MAIIDRKKLSLRSLVSPGTAAALLLIALAGWACTHETSGNKMEDANGHPCDSSTGPGEPKACDPDGDIYKECPLPQTQSSDDGSYTTVTYFSDPACVEGSCHYCTTSTTTEDPGATGAP